MQQAQNEQSTSTQMLKETSSGIQLIINNSQGPWHTKCLTNIGYFKRKNCDLSETDIKGAKRG